MSTLLDLMKTATRSEIEEARAKRPLAELKRMIPDAPCVRGLANALSGQFGLIAEIKSKSPSVGNMRPENVAAAAAAYDASPKVRAISVLTNRTYFGQSIEYLQNVRRSVSKPVLRKEFIFDEYQVYEARAFGADGILLMANLLTSEELKKLFNLASEVGLDVLFESHTKEEIESMPANAKIYGVNSRKFKTKTGGKFLFANLYARYFKRLGKGPSVRDFSTDLEVFEQLISYLPKHAVKVAESGVRPDDVPKIKRLGFNAILVGTSLLMSPDGLPAMLRRFEEKV